MVDESEPNAAKSYTAPKGRPTRGRAGGVARRRAFGPLAQWIMLTIALIVIFVIVILITNGGDFNPYNNSGAPASPELVAPGEWSTPR